MPQWELGCIIALPHGNLLNKYLARQWRETNNSFPIIAVVYYYLLHTLAGESNSPRHLKVKRKNSYSELSFAIFIFGVNAKSNILKLWTVKTEEMVKTFTPAHTYPKMHTRIAVDLLWHCELQLFLFAIKFGGFGNWEENPFNTWHTDFPPPYLFLLASSNLICSAEGK